MANKKISSLTDLSTSTSSEDLLHIVDYDSINGHVNKRISLASLFASIPSKLVLAGKLIISGTSQNITNDVSYVKIDSISGTQSSPNVYTLPSAAVEGQLVNIIQNLDTHATPFTVYNKVIATGGYCCGNTSVQFQGNGGTLQLLFDGVKWNILGSYNVTIA
jgi:hypothetical protein